MMSRTWSVMKREFAGYFATPVAYVFIVIFLFTVGIFTFQIGRFYENRQADLSAFFTFHPWLYLFLIPAISMRLWAEERKQGTLELLMTLPIPLASAVLGKFLASWFFAGIALALTFPIWITVNYLGDPDNGVVIAAYLGSWLMAGAYLAIGSCVSAFTRNQVIAFVVTVVICFFFIIAGFGPVTSMIEAWMPQSVVDAVASFSFLERFENPSRGIIDLRDIIFFATLIGASLVCTGIVVDAKKGA